MNPFVLGITGGIGSGKSCVSRLLASYCLAPLVDIDQCCRHLLEIEQPGWRALQTVFGGTFFLDNGSLDRVALRRTLFEDAAIRRQVDAVLHPLAREAMRARIIAYSAPLVFVEIPLLFEAGWEKDVDAVLVVYARKAVRCLRIMRRDGVSRREASKAMVAQMDLQEKADRADFLVDNSRAWVVTRSEVISLGNLLSERFPGCFCQESA